MPAPSNSTGTDQSEQTVTTQPGTSSTTPLIQSTAPPPGFMPRYNVQIEQFNGKGNAGQWWTMFVAFVTLQRMPEAESILVLPFHLSGIAREWFNILDSSCKTSLSTIKDAFLKLFKPMIKQGVKLTDLKQGDNETVDEYIHRALSLNSDNCVSEDFLVSITEKGFRKNLAHIIMPRRSQTMEQLREIAAVAEMTVSVTDLQPMQDITRTINAAVCSAVASCESNMLSQLMNRMDTTLAAVSRPEQHRVQFNTARTTPNYQNKQFSSRQCQYCGGKSCSTRSQCPASNKTCIHCKKTGHFKRVCLKLKREQAEAAK